MRKLVQKVDVARCAILTGKAHLQGLYKGYKVMLYWVSNRFWQHSEFFGCSKKSVPVLQER